jgi:hypothetical protein
LIMIPPGPMPGARAVGFFFSFTDFPKSVKKNRMRAPAPAAAAAPIRMSVEMASYFPSSAADFHPSSSL